jgi:hypothetical protein
MDILTKNNWNTKHLITAIVITGSVVFAATMIWNRFLYTESENKALKTLHENDLLELREDLDYFNNRINKKHDAQKEYIDEKIRVLSKDNINQWEVINTK